MLGKVVTNGLLCLSNDLDLDTLGAKIVKAKLASGSALAVDAACNAKLDLGLRLSLGQSSGI